MIWILLNITTEIHNIPWRKQKISPIFLELLNPPSPLAVQLIEFIEKYDPWVVTNFLENKPNNKQLQDFRKCSLIADSMFDCWPRNAQFEPSIADILPKNMELWFYFMTFYHLFLNFRQFKSIHIFSCWMLCHLSYLHIVIELISWKLTNFGLIFRLSNIETNCRDICHVICILHSINL